MSNYRFRFPRLTAPIIYRKSQIFEHFQALSVFSSQAAIVLSHIRSDGGLTPLTVQLTSRKLLYAFGISQ